MSELNIPLREILQKELDNYLLDKLQYFKYFNKYNLTNSYSLTIPKVVGKKAIIISEDCGLDKRYKEINQKDSTALIIPKQIGHGYLILKEELEDVYFVEMEGRKKRAFERLANDIDTDCRIVYDWVYNNTNLNERRPINYYIERRKPTLTIKPMSGRNGLGIYVTTRYGIFAEEL